MNLAAWIAAAIQGTFAIYRFLDPPQGSMRAALFNAATAVCLAALPLLHRFSPIAAPLVFVALAYAFLFFIISRTGTAGGSWLYYLSTVPLLILGFGPERLYLTAALSALAAALAIIAHMAFPPNTDTLSSSTLLYVNFVAHVAVSTALVFTLLHYAMRQVERAEAVAEREYAKSESLLLNILPSSVAERLKVQESVIADNYENASILFADMAGYTTLAAETPPEVLVQFLNTERISKVEASRLLMFSAGFLRARAAPYRPCA